MSDIGPELPPHLLAKRKRKQEEAAETASSTAPGAKQAERSPNGEKRQRVMGPAMPPAPMDERPLEPAQVAEESSSDEDDGFGPALPSQENEQRKETKIQQEISASQPPREEKPKRDDWMMMPPKQDDLAARMDPTKIRARGFNTGKSARAPQPGGEDNSAWHETPEQKQKRLADEMMGVSKPAGSQRSEGKDSKLAKDLEVRREMGEVIVRPLGFLSTFVYRVANNVYRRSQEGHH